MADICRRIRDFAEVRIETSDSRPRLLHPVAFATGVVFPSVTTAERRATMAASPAGSAQPHP